MVVLLVKAFDAAQSPAAIWAKFCELPELSQIGAVTVVVFLGALIFSTLKRLVEEVWRLISKLASGLS